MVGEIVGEFQIDAAATIVASGGIGGNHDLVRRRWPERLGPPPATMVMGVPAYVDGAMLGVSETAGARLINGDRMWHYVEGVQNWSPIWPGHGIRILPGPSSLWLDATGRRLPVPLYPGFDTLGTLAHLRSTGHDHSWFVLSQKIIEKEFTLSGSEQNPDLTGKDISLLLRSRLGRGASGPVQAFLDRGDDFVVSPDLDGLIVKMRELPGGDALDSALVRAEVEGRDREVGNTFTKDAQIAMLRSARAYRGDRLVRTASPHRLLDPAAGPLIAVKLHILTRKSLGGIETDLSSRALGATGDPSRCWSCRSSSASTRPVRRAVSAGAAFTAIARWRGRSSAGASSPVAPQDERRPPRSEAISAIRWTERRSCPRGPAPAPPRGHGRG